MLRCEKHDLLLLFLLILYDDKEALETELLQLSLKFAIESSLSTASRFKNGCVFSGFTSLILPMLSSSILFTLLFNFLLCSWLCIVMFFGTFLKIIGSEIVTRGLLSLQMKLVTKNYLLFGLSEKNKGVSTS